MAKEKPRCVLCGEEPSVFKRGTISIFGVGQTVCSECKSRYERSAGWDRDALDQRAMSSPYLENREAVQRGHTEAQARQQRAEERRRLEEERVRAASQRAILRCCDQDMTSLGTFDFQQGTTGFLDLPDWLEGSLTLVVYRCGCCGQVKFFDPKFVPDTRK